MSCVHSTPAQGRSRGRAPLFLIQEYPRLPGFPSDVYGIMTQRSDSARPRPYAELDQALHTLGGYVLLCTCNIMIMIPSSLSRNWYTIRTEYMVCVCVCARACTCTHSHAWPSRPDEQTMHLHEVSVMSLERCTL